VSRFSTTNEAAAAGYFVRLGYMCELDFSGGYVRAWSGLGDLTTMSRTFTGLGDLAGISAIEETGEISPRNLTVGLSGVPSAIIATVLGENYRGRAGRVWMGFFNSAWALLADPDLVFAGRMDTCTIQDDGPTCSVSVNLESRLVDLRRPRTRRYSHEDLTARYSGDNGLQFVARLSERPIYFGARGPNGVPGYS
jgi:hypothetical protein